MIRMETPDPLMDPHLSKFLCSALNFSPGHESVHRSFNTTMNRLHFLSIQYDDIHSDFDNLPQSSTADIFAELLLLIQWAIHHRCPLDESTPSILDNLEYKGTDAELK